MGRVAIESWTEGSKGVDKNRWNAVMEAPYEPGFQQQAVATSPKEAQAAAGKKAIAEAVRGRKCSMDAPREAESYRGVSGEKTEKEHRACIPHAEKVYAVTFGKVLCYPLNGRPEIEA